MFGVYDIPSILQGLQQLFTVHTIFWMLIGFGLGFFVGVVPGFNDANLMAIMLPFSLMLSPQIAIVTMATLYMAAQAAGSVPAILLNIPGTGGTSASILEGYPLSKKGKAGFAMGVSFTASTIGGLIGAVLALFITPVIGAFALRFGPAEMFMVGIFGLTVVASLSGKSLTKGLLAAAFGVLIALIGEDSMAGFPRSTFGIYDLYDGIPLIPALLGLFGFSEVIFMLGKTVIAQEGSSEVVGWNQIKEGIREAVRHKFTLIRSSIIGEVIGIIPGAGATIGGFVAYGQARMWSKEPEKFGTGHADGLVATDSANNATASGAIVPLLTLGLPGSGSTVVMLAALMLHGVRPGPRFFINFQAEAYLILLSVVLSALFIFIFGMPLARYSQKITFIPTKILVPIIVVLLFMGSYAWRYSAFDILLMIFFGVLGTVLKAYEYPIPALLLALILGPIIEPNFLRALSIGGAQIFFTSPIVLVLWAFTLVSLLGPLISKLRRKR